MTQTAVALSVALLVIAPCAAQVAPDQAKIDAVTAGTLTEAKASWWGWDPEDSTAALQAAIDSGVPKLTVDRMAGPWVVTPIKLVSNQEILFEEGVEVLAKRGEFKAKTASLFRASNIENVTLSGYGATWRMWREDYDNPDLYDKAEWRMCLAMGGCTNIKVLGLTLTESGGDGIYLGRGAEGATNKDIVIKDVVCDRNYRQGISVITAENLLIEGCTLSNTDGTNPRAGIDFEPNNPDERLVNCVMRDCVLENNAGAGITLYLRPMNATSEDISLRFENCHCIGNRTSAHFTVGGTAEAAPDGTCDFVDCVFDSPVGEAIAVSKPASRGFVRFVNCTVNNPAAALPGVSPIILMSDRTANIPAGGIEFVDCVIQDPVERNPMTFVDGGGVGLENVTGSLILDRGGERRTVPLTREVMAEWMPFLRFKVIPHLTLEGVTLQPLVPDAAPTAFDISHVRVRNFGDFLLWAEQGDEVSFTIDYLQVGQYTGDPMGVVVTAPSGQEAHRATAAFKEQTVVSFTAPETGVYRLAANPTRNRMHIIQTTHRINASGDTGAVRLIHGGGDYWFWVPAGTTEFGVRVCGEGAGEGIAAELVNPQGEVVDSVDNTAAVYQFEVQQPADTPGRAWLLRLKKPSGMQWEDHYVDLRGVPPVLAPTREALLVPGE